METIVENVPTGSHEGREPQPRVFEIVVVYNGIKKPLKVALDEAMKAALQEAIALFGSPPNPHLLSLFTEEGRELPENGTVKEAGLKPGQKVLLRPSTVKGG